MTIPIAIDTDLQNHLQALPGHTMHGWSGQRCSREHVDGPSSSATVRQQLVVRPTSDRYELVEQLKAAVGDSPPSVLKLFPGARGDGFPLATWVLDPLTALCERDGYGLAIDYGSDGPAALVELDEFARQAPEVPVLVLGEHLDPRLGFWRLLDRCPSVLLEVTPNADTAAAVAAVTTFGPHRFAFGSRGYRVEQAFLDFLDLLDDASRDTVLRGTADRLDKRTWRDDYL